MKKSKEFTLLSTMFRSTSGINVLKNSKDKKKKGKVIGGFFGIAFVYIILAAYMFFQAYMMGSIGLGDSVPAMNVIVLSALAFFFTIFKSNGYLYNFKEYDMIMSMPFEAKTIVKCKFLYMYIKGLTLPMIISLSMMLGYALALKPGFYVYVFWVIMSFFVQLIPTVIASFLASLVAKTGGKGRLKKVLQTILLFAVAMLGVSLRFIIEYFVRESTAENMVTSVTSAADAAKKWYFPALWFEKAVNDSNVLMFLLLIVVSLVVFALYYTFVAKSYRRMNTKLSSYSGTKSGKQMSFKKKSVVISVFNKEVRRFFSSVTYMTNMGMGQVMSFVFGIVILFVDIDKITDSVMPESGLTAVQLAPAIPFLIFLFIGMTSTTSVSPSLEGKNYWIIQSMPVKMSDLYKGKMLFNIVAFVPFGWFGVTTFCIAFHTTLLQWAYYMTCETVMCLFSTAYGMFCGVKFQKLEWENEIEVIKQGTAVSVYLFPNMIFTMIFMVISVIIGMFIPGNLVILGITFLYAILAFVMYEITMMKA